MKRLYIILYYINYLPISTRNHHGPCRVIEFNFFYRFFLVKSWIGRVTHPSWAFVITSYRVDVTHKSTHNIYKKKNIIYTSSQIFLALPRNSIKHELYVLLPVLFYSNDTNISIPFEFSKYRGANTEQLRFVVSTLIPVDV